MKTLFDLNKKEFEDSKLIKNSGFVYGEIDGRYESTVENIRFTYMEDPYGNKKYVFSKKYNQQILNRYYKGCIENLVEFRGEYKCCKPAQMYHVILVNGEVSIWSCSEDFF